MRLFTALELPPEARKHAHGLQSSLRELEMRGVKWVEPNNLHITLKFLGENDPERVQDLIAALKPVRVDPMTLFADRFQKFPPRGPARVLAAGIGGDSGRISQLFDAIEAVCENFGVPREKRSYTPHITLGRARDGVRVHADLSSRFPGPQFVLNSFTLFKSVLGHHGPTYERLATCEEKVG